MANKIEAAKFDRNLADYNSVSGGGDASKIRTKINRL